MQVHEIVNYAALQIVLDLVDDDMLADVDEFDIGQVFFVVADCLVDFFVVADAIPEILGSHFGILAFVVGGCGFDFEDVAHDQSLVVTFRFDVEGFDVVCFTSLVHPPSTCFGGVGGVEYGYYSLTHFKPLDHIGHRGFSCSVTQSFAFWVTLVEEVGCGLWSVGSTIGSDIEGFGRYAKPTKVTDNCKVQDGKLRSS